MYEDKKCALLPRHMGVDFSRWRRTLYPCCVNLVLDGHFSVPVNQLFRYQKNNSRPVSSSRFRLLLYKSKSSQSHGSPKIVVPFAPSQQDM